MKNIPLSPLLCIENNLIFENLSVPDYSIDRKELFNRYFKWRVMTHDLDHTHYCTILTEDYDIERKIWFSFCFGMTYRTPQAFVFSETFPNIHECTISEIEEWHAKNWKRTSYGTDARYNKGHFVKQVQSIKQWLDGKSFQEKINSIVVSENSRENFYNLYSEVTSLYKFGRMTGWITLQCLFDLCKLHIDPLDIMIDGFNPNNDSSLGSIWNGLCAYENRHEKMIGGKYGNYVVNQEDILYAKEKLMEYTSIAESFSGFTIDSFRKESIWCQYKRLFNESASKEYPGHASGDAVSRYLFFRDTWPEIDWSKFRKALRSQPGMICGLTYQKWMDEIFGQFKVPIFMEELYDDYDFSTKELIPWIESYRVREIWEDDNIQVPESFNFHEMVVNSPKYYCNII